MPWDTQYLPHPSRGGSRGYDIHHRWMVVDLYCAGNPAPGGMLRSIQRWIANGVIPFLMTGNKPSSGLSGEYLLLLVIFTFLWPQSNYCECIAVIANESNDARIFSESKVGLALRKLGYTQKATSTVAYQAFTQVNLNRRRLFWTRPWPVGIHGVPRHQLIVD